MKTVKVVEDLELISEEVLEFIKNCSGEICDSGICKFRHICDQLEGLE